MLTIQIFRNFNNYISRNVNKYVISALFNIYIYILIQKYEKRNNSIYTYINEKYIFKNHNLCIYTYIYDTFIGGVLIPYTLMWDSSLVDAKTAWEQEA